MWIVIVHDVRGRILGIVPFTVPTSYYVYTITFPIKQGVKVGNLSLLESLANGGEYVL